MRRPLRPPAHPPAQPGSPGPLSQPGYQGYAPYPGAPAPLAYGPPGPRPAAWPPTAVHPAGWTAGQRPASPHAPLAQAPLQAVRPGPYPGAPAVLHPGYPGAWHQGPPRRNPLSTRTGRILTTTGIILLALLAGLVSLGSQWNDAAARGVESQPLQMLQFVVSMGLVASLGVRRRFPAVLTACSGLAGALLALDTTVGLIASTTLLARAPSWRTERPRALKAYGALAVLAVGTLLAVRHDALMAPRGNSVLGIFLFPRPDGAAPQGVIGWPAQVLATALILAIPFIVGTILAARRREVLAATQAADARAQRARAEEEAAQAARTSEVLMDQVELREERERIAHEVHDGLGHRLSVLAMQAGLLERSADEGTAQAARRVRQSSQEAMGELRSLLEVLRDPGGSAGQPAPRLEELAAVVDSMVEAGTPLSSSIVLDRPAQASSVLSHAVYRIVQECLTNASKHSPSEPIRLRVEGSPETGIHLRCSNRLVPAEDRPEEPGSGTGLRGMAHRVQICGGRLRAGPSPEGEFIVEVDLPWLPGPSPQQ
ncbi:MAG: histidine kinase [Actinomyces bowdenii]|nr:histidine kinase [Actinomyces bowdenii]